MGKKRLVGPSNVEGTRMMLSLMKRPERRPERRTNEIINLVDQSAPNQTDDEETQPPPGYYENIEEEHERPAKKSKRESENASEGESAAGSQERSPPETNLIPRLSQTRRDPLQERQPDEDSSQKVDDLVIRDGEEAKVARAMTSTWYSAKTDGTYELKVGQFPRGDYDVFSVISEDMQARIAHEKFELRMRQVKELYVVSELYMGMNKRNEAKKIYEKIHEILFGLLKSYGE